MTITFPTDTKEVIDDIREAIGRNVTINVKTTGTPCPVCDLDPVTNTSTDSFCETCDGKYWIDTTTPVVVLGHVRWIKNNQPLYTPGGVIDEGDCIVTIEYTAQNLQYVENSESWIVDGQDMYYKTHVPRGKPDINRIRVILKEDAE